MTTPNQNVRFVEVGEAMPEDAWCIGNDEQKKTPLVGSECIDADIYQTRTPRSDRSIVEGIPWHNPDNLTPEQVGVSEGWRLCLKDERCNIPHQLYCPGSNTKWEGGAKDGDLVFGDPQLEGFTYRTREPLPEKYRSLVNESKEQLEVLKDNKGNPISIFTHTKEQREVIEEARKAAERTAKLLRKIWAEKPIEEPPKCPRCNDTGMVGIPSGYHSTPCSCVTGKKLVEKYNSDLSQQPQPPKEVNDPVTEGALKRMEKLIDEYLNSREAPTPEAGKTDVYEESDSRTLATMNTDLQFQIMQKDKEIAELRSFNSRIILEAAKILGEADLSLSFAQMIQNQKDKLTRAQDALREIKEKCHESVNRATWLVSSINNIATAALEDKK